LGVPRATAVAAIALDKTLELIINFSFLLVGVAVVLQTQLLPGYRHCWNLTRSPAMRNGM
jgi:hypothetical protein